MTSEEEEVASETKDGVRVLKQHEKNLVISITRAYESLKSDLSKLAEADHRSLSNYVVMVLSKHVQEKRDTNK